MKKTKGLSVIGLFVILSMLLGNLVAFASPGATKPILDGFLDEAYLTHARTTDFQGFHTTGSSGDPSSTLYVLDDSSLDSTYVWLAWVIDRSYNDLSYG